MHASSLEGGSEEGEMEMEEGEFEMEEGESEMEYPGEEVVISVSEEDSPNPEDGEGSDPPQLVPIAASAKPKTAGSTVLGKRLRKDAKVDVDEFDESDSSDVSETSESEINSDMDTEELEEREA